MSSLSGRQARTTILIGDTIASYTQQRGVVRSFRAAITALDRAMPGGIILTSLVQSPENYRGQYHRLPRSPAGAQAIVRDIAISLLAAYERPRLYFSPYYGNVFAKSPQLFTVYDVIHERFPQYFPPQNRAVRQFLAEKRRCLERASMLLAISASTARDIGTYYPHIDPSKIRVVPLGVEEHFFDYGPGNPFRGRPYFLYVGNRSGYKNFARALAAFGESGLAQQFTLRVVSPVGGTYSAEEQAIIQRYDLDNAVQMVTDIDEKSLRTLYSQAVALIYPSEYEGFGLPILEAFASGTLVTTSDTSSMPEVGGDVADYFDPYSTASIAESLRRIAYLPMEARHERIEAGIARARNFGWDRYGERIVAIFQRCLTDQR